MARTPTEKLLHDIPMFGGCSRKEIALLASLCTEISVAEGQALTRQGTLGREFFVLMSGTADVVRGGKVIAQLTAGSPVGEMALLHGTKRNATVIATSPVQAIVLSKQEFASALFASPSLNLAITTAAVVRSGGDPDRFVSAA